MIALKRMILAGKNFSVNTKKDENSTVIDWLNSQSNLSDSIRFLIEQDIKLYGVRNLQQIIPADRGYNFQIDKAVLNYNTAPIEIKEKIETDAAEKTVEDAVNKKTSTYKGIEKKTVTKEVIDAWD